MKEEQYKSYNNLFYFSALYNTWYIYNHVALHKKFTACIFNVKTLIMHFYNNILSFNHQKVCKVTLNLKSTFIHLCWSYDVVYYTNIFSYAPNADAVAHS
jgi:hypothetical protein